MVEREAVCVYQFKAALRGVSPMVWRRILLRSDQTIADLHYGYFCPTPRKGLIGGKVS